MLATLATEGIRLPNPFMAVIIGRMFDAIIIAVPVGPPTIDPAIPPATPIPICAPIPRGAPDMLETIPLP